MSSTTAVIRSMTIYGGIPIFIFGTLGNVFNIGIFWKTRQNSCAFIFLISSCVNGIVLFYGLFTRILSVGFDLDWSNTNVIWCKTRVAFTQASFLISLTCFCLASIDRFLVSCRQEKYRKLSRIKLTKLSIIIIILFWFGHSIPYLFHAELIPNSSTGIISCSLITNKYYPNYRIYVVLPIYLGLSPTLILTVTGLLTYKNTNQLKIGRQRQLIQKQLTSMMLIQIPIILISTLPYIIFCVYSAMTSTYVKSASQKYTESIVTNIVNLMFYITFASAFFIFFCSSRTFRKDFKCLILCRISRLLNNNQIQPQSTATIRNITK